MSTQTQPERRPEGEEGRAPKAVRLLTGFLRALSVQIKVAPTLAVSIAVTFSLTVYSFTTIVSAADTGWEVSGTQTTTALAVTIERALEVKNDVRITGSVLQMAGSVCDEESPAGTGRICFDGDAFRLSQNGGGYLTMDGLDCWDANGNGRRDASEDRTGDGRLDALDCQGAPGLRGPGGDRGLRGPRGDTGGAGPRGPTGATGLQGQKGDTGDAGPRGQDGDSQLQGPKGDKGDTGAIGLRGPKGDAGLRGLKGDKGDVGLRGPKGDKGDAGLPGPKGDKGDAGPLGPKGDKGDTGLLGPKGDAGEPGLAVGVSPDPTQETCVIQLPKGAPLAGGTAALVDGACRIVLSDLAIAAAKVGRLNVEVTARGDPFKLAPIQLYFQVFLDDAVPFIWVFESEGRDGSFDFMVQVLK